MATQRLFARLAARTLAYDNFLMACLDGGARQAVVIGAGYDSRWSVRLARPGVQFFEVDHPATQADKRNRLGRLGTPTDAIRFVPVDLAEQGCTDALIDAGFDVTAPTAYIVEGVSMYLTAEENHALLSDLRASSAEGSALGVDFASPPGSPPAGVLGVAAKAVFGVLQLATKRAGETVELLCDAESASAIVRQAGWQVKEVRAALALWRQYLSSGSWPRVEDGTPIIITPVAVSGHL